MTTRDRWTESAVVTLAYGVTLLGATAVWHLGFEASAIDSVSGPVAAFLLDGTLAAAIVGTAVWLARSELAEPERRTVVVASVGGSVTFTLAIGATIVVRTLEGRGVSEVPFVLFTTLAAGFLAGALAGVFRATVDHERRRLRRTRDAMAFVNGMLRHDVRNDANVIVGYAQQLETDTEAGEVVRERASTVIERTEQARAVTETVTGDAEPEPRDVRPMLAEAADTAARTYQSARIETDLPDRLTARANEALRPALDNLLENAVEHNDRQEPIVSLTAASLDDGVRIRVVDDGPGLGEQDRAALFDYDAGTAKGLNVVSTIVDGLDGTIHVEDNEPRGTAFVIDLPGADAPTAESVADPFGADPSAA